MSTDAGAYAELVRRLNLHPQGAPPSASLYSILRLLMNSEEAALVARLPIRPFSAGRAAAIWGMDRDAARRVLDRLAERALIIDLRNNGRVTYLLPPPMAGFFEFSMMRIRSDIDQRRLSELFYQYLNVEEDFIRDLFTRNDGMLGRVFVNESSLPAERLSVVLDHDRAGAVIRAATHIGVSLCYCRHKMGQLGRACAAPLEICLTLNNVAGSLVRHGFARSVAVSEALDLLELARENDLVQFGDNVRHNVSFICNCCGCCCEALLAAKRVGFPASVQTGYVMAIDRGKCTGCGRCVSLCPVDAIRLEPGPDGRKVASLDEDRCLGCGVCVRRCPAGALKLEARPGRVLPPYNSSHRAVLAALETGRLQNLIIDSQARGSWRALAAVLGAVFRLPPVKRLLAGEQFRSRYLEAMFRRWDG